MHIIWTSSEGTIKFTIVSCLLSLSFPSTADSVTTKSWSLLHRESHQCSTSLVIFLSCARTKGARTTYLHSQGVFYQINCSNIVKSVPTANSYTSLEILVINRELSVFLIFQAISEGGLASSSLCTLTSNVNYRLAGQTTCSNCC